MPTPGGGSCRTTPSRRCWRRPSAGCGGVRRGGGRASRSRHSTRSRSAFLNAATAKQPVAVLGATAAQRLGIDRVYPGERIWVGGQWFYVAGILKPAALTPEIDTAVLVGFPAAQTYLGFDGHPSTIYVRSRTDQVTAVQSVLAATAKPQAPNDVDVSRPSDAP